MVEGLGITQVLDHTDEAIGTVKPSRPTSSGEGRERRSRREQRRGHAAGAETAGRHPMERPTSVSPLAHFRAPGVVMGLGEGVNVNRLDRAVTEDRPLEPLPVAAIVSGRNRQMEKNRVHQYKC